MSNTIFGRTEFQSLFRTIRVRSRHYPKTSRQIRRAYQILVPERSLLHYRRRNFHSLQFEKSDGSLFFLRIREIRRVVDHQFTTISFFEMKIVRKKEERRRRRKRRIELSKILSLDKKKKRRKKIINSPTNYRICKKKIYLRKKILSNLLLILSRESRFLEGAGGGGWNKFLASRSFPDHQQSFPIKR